MSTSQPSAPIPQHHENGRSPAPRADSLEARIDALKQRFDARRRQEAPGQLGLSLGASPSESGKGTGEPCGQSWISRDKDCHKEGGEPADDRPIGQRKGTPKLQGSESERAPGADSGTSLASRANDARRRLVSTIGEVGGLDEKTADLVADFYLAKPKDGGAGVATLDPAIGQFNIKHGMFMDREAINHVVAKAMQWDAGRQRAQRRESFLAGLTPAARTKAAAALEKMVKISYSSYATRQELVEQRVGEGFAPVTTAEGERRLVDRTGAFLTVRDVSAAGMDYAAHLISSKQAEPVLTNPGRQDPGLAPKAKPAGINAQDVTTSSQQAAFARQQQQAAKTAGDERGAQAWRKEERMVERQRLQGAITRGQQSQTSLFGATEYDQTMPLFQQPAAAAGPRRRLGGSSYRRDAADDRLDDAIERLAVLRARMDQRCRRPDGSHYGTGGDCRQGIRAGIARAVEQRVQGLGRRLLGRGQQGPNGDVMASAERIQQMAAARRKEEAERQAKEKAREQELLSRGPQKWGVKQVEKEEVRGSGDKGVVWHESRYEVQLEQPLRLPARPGKETRLVDKLSFQVAVEEANAKPIARKLHEQGIKLSNGQVNNALELAWLTGAGGGEAFMGADRMELPKNVARRFAMEVSKQVKGLVSNMEEGQIVICKAHQDDGYGDKRRSLYERAGFTFIDGTGIAVVRNGRLSRIKGASGDRVDANDAIDLEGLLVDLLTLGGSRPPDADAEPIDWNNVAVETEVMLRLQQAPPLASARQGQPQAKG